jgi:hypothetical protein
MTRDNDEELFNHQVTAWTADERRKALDRAPDHMPVRVVVADEPGGMFAGDEQVVIGARLWTAQGIPSSRTAPQDCFAINSEFPSGHYYRRQR